MSHEHIHINADAHCRHSSANGKTLSPGFVLRVLPFSASWRGGRGSNQDEKRRASSSEDSRSSRNESSSSIGDVVDVTTVDAETERVAAVQREQIALRSDLLKATLSGDWGKVAELAALLEASE